MRGEKNGKKTGERGQQERERERERAGNEIKLETWNISPLGAVAILRTISIRDVVIVNERNVPQNGWEHFRFFSAPLTPYHPSPLPIFALVFHLEIEQAIIDLPARIDLFSSVIV